MKREESGQAPAKLNGFGPKTDRTSPGQVVTQLGNTKEMLVCIVQYTIRRTKIAAPGRRGHTLTHGARVKLAASARREGSAGRL